MQTVIFRGKKPKIDAGARLAATATCIGDVQVHNGANLWYGAVLRGDFAQIIVGEGSNVQDNAVIHSDVDVNVIIGKNVTIGHGAILHGCTIEDGCLIGMGAILLDHCVIGAGSIVAAGALLPRGVVIPPNSLVLGSPGKARRETSPEERKANLANAKYYGQMAREQLETP